MNATAEAVAARLDGEPRHILDVGTGTGLWSLAMARRLRHAKVVAVDFPQVLANHFFKRAEQLDCRERVEALEGGYEDFPPVGGRRERCHSA